ncbi:MAG: hypothetical protein H0V09_06320, partial [Gemmatimonadetes bacterium]|nr:hypothetical protein [Gemmatimonadota bacterium]
PAPGQGAIAVQRRASDGSAATLLEPLHDIDTWSAVTAERAFLADLGAGCSAPVAALAEVHARRLEMRALAAAEDGTNLRRVSGTGDPARPEELGSRLAREVGNAARGGGGEATG